MPDREKVISRVEGLAEDDWRLFHSDSEVQNIAIEVLALLKEQEAVEPYVTGNGESFETTETWWYECGNCNKPIDPNDKFCRHCGQAVKWE